MLPIYSAVQHDRILVGGSTKPWLVLVNKDQKPVPYVVKLYDRNYVNDFHVVAKEVYCSILASEFGIDTPSPALIEFSAEFIKTLSEECRRSLDNKHKGLKFATEMISPSFQYHDDLKKADLWKYDIETIYAFDNLVKSNDRKREKPNILMKAKSMYVIDHENSLTINDKTIQLFEKDNNLVYWKENHIFYKFLKERGIETKRTFFERFSSLLKTVNFDRLDPYFAQLEALGHDNGLNYYQIKEYLCYMQRNSDKFVQLLKGNL